MSRRNHSVQNPWTPEQRQILTEWRDQGIPYADIADKVGHSVKSCENMRVFLRQGRRSRYDKAKVKASHIHATGDPAQMQRMRERIKERAADYAAALSGRDPVATFLNDPPKGYSALDKKQKMDERP